MDFLPFLVLVSVVYQLTKAFPADDVVKEFPFLMPSVQPTETDQYICTPVKVEETKPYFIVGFEPNAAVGVVHHMLLYGCSEPGRSDLSWNCREMAGPPGASTPPCREGAQVLYAWAHDAPMFRLPEQVGFKVGAQTQIQYLVLQIHYSNVQRFQDGSTDNSGIILQYTEKSLPRLAGVLQMGTLGRIPPHAIEHMETACTIQEHIQIHPFAFRTHTHSLGKLVSGYLVRRDQEGEDHWILLGRKDPQKPQMFYPMTKNVTVRYGDQLAARCTMVSNRDYSTMIGYYHADIKYDLKVRNFDQSASVFAFLTKISTILYNDVKETNKDEMCNFYVMYWVEGGMQTLNMQRCFTDGPPSYRWTSHLNNIPDAEASSLTTLRREWT